VRGRLGRAPAASEPPLTGEHRPIADLLAGGHRKLGPCTVYSGRVPQCYGGAPHHSAPHPQMDSVAYGFFSLGYPADGRLTPAFMLDDYEVWIVGQEPGGR